MDNHILVVEDDAAIREGVRILLEGEGYIVQEAEDGYQCLKKVSDDIDLVILDIMMPGIDGLEVCREIRKTSNIPILILSAKAEDMDKIAEAIAMTLKEEGSQEKAKAIVKELTDKYPLVG